MLSSVENERVFSIVAFLKTRICNRLIDHLPLVVNLFGQRHLILENLPFDKFIVDWEVSKRKRGRYAMHQ